MRSKERIQETMIVVFLACLMALIGFLYGGAAINQGF